MLPATDGNVLLEDPLDPMLPALGSFELIDDDPRTLGWAEEPLFRRTTQLVKLPALICGGLLLACGLILSFTQGVVGGPRPDKEASRSEAATRIQHPSLVHARNRSNTGITHGSAASHAPVVGGGITTTSTTSTTVTRTGMPETSDPSAVVSATRSRSSTHVPAATATATAWTTAATSTTTQAPSSTTCASPVWNRYHECQSRNSWIRALRCQRWPCEHKGPAPEISRALYINLDRDFVRRNWMEGQLQNLSKNLTAEAQLRGEQRNFATERVSAVDIRQARSDPDYEPIRRRGFNPTPYPNVKGKWSVTGCSLSHLKILRRLREHADELLARHQVWLILEDDAIITPKIDSDWRRLWPWLPDEWDVARLGWFGASTCEGRVNNRVDLALWSDPPPSGPCSYCGSHAYIVNPASIDRVLHRIEGSKMMHVDCLLGAPTPPMEDPDSLPEMRVYAARPILVLQNEEFPSDNIS